MTKLTSTYIGLLTGMMILGFGASECSANGWAQKIRHVTKKFTHQQFKKLPLKKAHRTKIKSIALPNNRELLWASGIAGGVVLYQDGKEALWSNVVGDNELVIKNIQVEPVGRGDGPTMLVNLEITEVHQSLLSRIFK